jgi:uncharacterized protein YkwD
MLLLHCGVAATFVAACGGGGGGDASVGPLAASSVPAVGGSPAAPTPPVASPGPAPSPSPAPAGNVATCGLPDFAASVLARVNQVRAAGAVCGGVSYAPAAALSWSGQLTQAATGHSQDMAANNYFSHTSLDGRSLADRINATGYLWTRLGENIAAGYPTVNAVMDGWVASAGHCANLMNPNFNQFGLACVPRAAGSDFSTYWTMDLATSR